MVNIMVPKKLVSRIGAGCIYGVLGHVLVLILWYQKHLYTNHLEQAHLQLTRAPRALPQLQLNPEVKELLAFRFEDFTLTDYDPYPHIPAPVAV